MIDNKVYNLPCQCSNCGTIYLSGLKFAGAYIKSEWNVKPELKNFPFTCPTCGKGNRANSDLIDLIEDSINAFKHIPIQDLLELQLKLKEKDSKGFTINDFQGAKEEILSAAPELQSLRDFVPKSRNEAYALFAVFIAAITLITQLIQSGSDDKPKIDQVINQSYTITINNYNPAFAPKPSVDQNKLKGYNKNLPCPCGSGKPYKRCHGK